MLINYLLAVGCVVISKFILAIWTYCSMPFSYWNNENHDNTYYYSHIGSHERQKKKREQNKICETVNTLAPFAI